MVISKIFWCNDFLYQIVTEKTPLSDIIFHEPFLMTLIFVCAGFLAQQLKINRKYTTIKRWLDTKLHQIRL